MDEETRKTFNRMKEQIAATAQRIDNVKDRPEIAKIAMRKVTEELMSLSEEAAEEMSDKANAIEVLFNSCGLGLACKMTLFVNLLAKTDNYMVWDAVHTMCASLMEQKLNEKKPH